jgi:DNA-binding NtrC family response regulator
LINHFLRQLNSSLGKHVTSVSPDALHVLENYSWPGNVRELQSAIKYAYVQSAGEVITSECLPAQLRGGTPIPRPSQGGDASRLEVADFVTRLLQAGQPDIYEKVQSAVDRVVMETVLKYAKGNQVQASELLGISRTTLRGKLRSLGLAIEKQLLPESNANE